MQKEIIYAGEIQPAKSIIGLLDGSEMFCLENPWFAVEGMKKMDKKSYLSVKSPKKQPGQLNFGTVLDFINLLARTNNRKPFTQWFSIALNPHKGESSKYYFMKPYDVSKITEAMKQKTTISPISDNTEELKRILVILSHQLSMLQDVVLLAAIFKIDMSKFAGIYDNRQFYTKFCAELTATMATRTELDNETIAVDDKYVESFINPPFYFSRDKKYIPLAELGKIKSQIPTLYNKFYSIYTSIDSSALQLGPYSQILNANTSAVPSIKYIDCIRKDTGEHICRFDSKFVINLQLAPEDKGYKADAKQSFLTKRLVSKNKCVPMTTAMYKDLYGSEKPDMNVNGASQIGGIFITPMISFKFFTTGSPTVDWRVEKIAVKRVSNNNESSYDDGNEFVDDELIDEEMHDEQFINDLGPNDDEY